MRVPKEYYDEIFQFKGQWDMPSACGLKIRSVNDITYVIVIELYQENPGTSVTYAGESLARQICDAKHLDFETIRYIECNPDTNSKLSFYNEMYFKVDFKAELRSRYTQLTEEEIKEIV